MAGEEKERETQMCEIIKNYLNKILM